MLFSEISSKVMKSKLLAAGIRGTGVPFFELTIVPESGNCIERLMLRHCKATLAFI